jgi:hypothetical protein
MLCRISVGRGSYDAERRLLSELSSLKPELKINAVTPESVTALETYSRAMVRSNLRPPLFLQMFHRNITLLGQHNELIAPAIDIVDQALWPVLGRLLRFHVGEVVKSGRVREWAVSSSLFFMTAGRQMAVMLETLRENDTRITEEADIRGSDSREARLNRRTTSLLRTAIVVAVFLFSAQIALSPGEGTYQLAAGIVALASAIALWFSVLGVR